MTGFKFPVEWEIEICARCGSLTTYDRDYGGPFPATECPFSDCPVNVDRFFGSCAEVVALRVVVLPSS